MPHAAPPPYEVRCPLHGSIPFDERERRVIDHPLLQRLRFVSQLGFASLVYPGATHTRFNHCLGVMHVAGLVFDHIATVDDTLHRAGYSDAELGYFRRVVRLAGLLHDVGHPPFSHTFEPLLPARAALPLPWAWYAQGAREGQATHEDYSVAAVASLATGSDPLLSSDEAQDVCALIDGRVQASPRLRDPGRPAFYPLLKQIISGEIDADRMDYLPRDSHFAGVTYGLFDMPRMIRSLACTPAAPGLVMTLDQSAVYTYENFLMARFHMAMQVYYHKTLLPFEHFLARAVAEGELRFPMDGSLENLLAAREDAVQALLWAAREGRWASRIVYRRPAPRLLQLDAPDVLPHREAVLAVLPPLAAQGIEVLHLREQRALSTLGEGEAGAPLYVRATVLGRTRHRPLQEASVLLHQYNQVFTIEGLYCDRAHYDRCREALMEALDGDAALLDADPLPRTG